MHDKNDAFFLAELERLNILPTGYIHAAEWRPVPDLLWRRMLLVGQWTALMLSFKSLYVRTTGGQMSLKRLKVEDSLQRAGGQNHLKPRNHTAFQSLLWSETPPRWNQMGH